MNMMMIVSPSGGNLDCRAGSATRQTLEGSDKDRHAVMVASAMLAKSLANPPSQAQLARAAGVSQRRLVQAFRMVCNTTIFGHLRQIRLQTVRRLVEETDMPLKQIAYEIGYGHANNLIAAYRDYYGEPPRRHVRNTADA